MNHFTKERKKERGCVRFQNYPGGRTLSSFFLKWYPHLFLADRPSPSVSKEGVSERDDKYIQNKG